MYWPSNSFNPIFSVVLWLRLSCVILIRTAKKIISCDQRINFANSSSILYYMLIVIELARHISQGVKREHWRFRAYLTLKHLIKPVNPLFGFLQIFFHGNLWAHAFTVSHLSITTILCQEALYSFSMNLLLLFVLVNTYGRCTVKSVKLP